MTLKQGSSKEVISENIAELVNSGRTVAQASAIAYASARKSHGIDSADEVQRNSSPEGFDLVSFIAFSDQDKLLFLKRDDGSWGFAGGHVEVGENPMQGAIRESIEEIQHAPQSGVQLIHVDGKCSLYHCDDGEFIPVLNDEHSGYVWATMEDAPYPLFSISEAMDEFKEEDHPRSESGQFGSGSSSKTKVASKVKLKEGHIELEKPLEFEKNAFGELEVNGINGRFDKDQVTISKGKIVGMRSKLAENLGLKSQGEIQPVSEQTLNKQNEAKKQKENEENARKEAAESSVFYMTIGNKLAGLSSENQNHIKANIAKLRADKSLTEIQRIRAIKADIASATDSAMDKREYDTNGWFEVKDNPLSVVGVYPYSERSLGISDRTDKFVYVLRPEEELSDKACIDSFKLLPWIDDHKMLGSEELGMTPAEQKGVQGVIGQEVYFKDGKVFGNLKIFSEAMSNSIAQGKKELSVGYRCRYEKQSGTFDGQSYDYVQRDIRGNHLALVDDGRMGAEVAVLDHSETKQKEIQMDPKDDVNKVEDEVEESGEMTLSEATAALEKIMPVVAKLQALVAGNTETESEVVIDEDEEKKDEDEKKSDAMDMNEIVSKVRAQIVSETAAKSKLHAQLAPHIGTFDHSEMDVAQVADYGCKQLGISAHGDKAAFLSAYLLGKGTPSTAMDSAPTRAKGNFLDRHMKGAE